MYESNQSQYFTASEETTAPFFKHSVVCL